MKLTKKKLEHLIAEEYVRRIRDERKPTNYPEYADKLTTLAKSDPVQAASLADSLDDPLDVDFDPNNMKTYDIDNPIQQHFKTPEYMLHDAFLIDGGGSDYTEQPDVLEIEKFAKRYNLDPIDTKNKIMKSYQVLTQHEYIKNR